MISTAIINLSVVLGFLLLLLIYSIRFVIRYKHQYESNPLCTTTVIFCLVVVLLTTFLLPVDIFLVSFVKEQDGSFKEWATNETLASIDTAVFGAYYGKCFDFYDSLMNLLSSKLVINQFSSNSIQVSIVS